MNMPIRYPNINFEECFPIWAPHLEFAMTMNASSILPAYLEPYIIKAFAKARPLLDPVKDAELIKEVDWFVAQESQHYRQHQRFNRVFQTPRYPQIEKLGKAYGVVLQEYLDKRSLMFNLAYTEGFESGGAVFYRLWFTKLAKYRAGAKAEALQLWDWHYAEEFEHREVAFKLYMAFAQRGNIFRRIWYSYFYRVYGVVKMLTDSGKRQRQMTEHLLEVERGEMTSENAAESVKRKKALRSETLRLTLSGLLGVLSPFYDPARKSPPDRVATVLADFGPGGRYARDAVKPA